MPRTLNWHAERERLRVEIHAITALQRSVGPDHYLSDLSLYATYLYCLASHASGHIHMATWNQMCTRQMTSKDLPLRVSIGSNPRSFGLEINNLKDQALFIDYARMFIVKRQEYMRKWNIKSQFVNLPVYFDLGEE